jgi:hypothetical protein
MFCPLAGEVSATISNYSYLSEDERHSLAQRIVGPVSRESPPDVRENDDVRGCDKEIQRAYVNMHYFSLSGGGGVNRIISPVRVLVYNTWCLSSVEMSCWTSFADRQEIPDNLLRLRSSLSSQKNKCVDWS